MLQFQLLGHGVHEVVLRHKAGTRQHLPKLFLGHTLDLQGVADVLVSDIPFVPQEVAYSNGSGHNSTLVVIVSVARRCCPDAGPSSVTPASP
ncbi:hypothetical protein JCM16814_04930 [Desulfobaculum senezii]